MTLLAYYEGLSLIPYFRDLDGRNIFIETTINRDTDSTGLYCAFNADLVEEDFYTGLVDLIGGTLVGSEKKTIDFLSYNETIVESVEFTQVPLDLPGNVVALFGTSSYVEQMSHAYGDPAQSGVVTAGKNRTAWFTEGAVLHVNVLEGDQPNSGYTYAGTGTSSTINVKYFADDTTVSEQGTLYKPFCIIGGQYVPIAGGTVSTTLRSIDYPYSNATASYTTVFTLNSSGVISSVSSYTPNRNPSVGSSDIVLGYISFDVYQSEFIETSIDFSAGAIIAVGGPTDYVADDYVDGAYLINGVSNDLTYGPSASIHDYYVYDLSNTVGFVQGDVRVEFFGTNAAADSKNYAQYRKIKIFNTILSFINSSYKDRATMIVSEDVEGNRTKKSLAGMKVTNIVTSTSQNKSFVLKTGLSDLSYISGESGKLFFYKNDNEFILGTDGLRTHDITATTPIGVVARYSTFYEKYFNGLINTGDFFYDNRLLTGSDGDVNSLINFNSGELATINVTFVNGEASPSPTNITTESGIDGDYAGYNYIVFESSLGGAQSETALDLGLLEQISFPQSESNTGVFTIVENTVNRQASAVELAQSLGFTASGNFFAYPVSENVTFEQLSNVTMVYNESDKHYLKMFIDLDGSLEVNFTEKSLISTENIDVRTNFVFNVQSELSNLKQTIEIENPSGYVEVPNKILVNGSRYTELKVGDFLLADNENVELAVGQFQRNLTRVLSKRQYAGNTSLSEITCDAKILKTPYTDTETGNIDYQTTRYSTVDQYSTTYKGIAMKGFRIRQASLPDGTETRQNQVLNLVAKGTPLFKALINKEAFDFRYLIDSFGLGLTERSKQQLVDICGERLNVFGFINMPSLKSFKNSSSPSFVNNEGTLQVEFIAKGGDPESNPAFLYSFGDGTGVSTVGYFTPYVTVNDNGRPLDFPPASYVATTFMRKHISNVSSVTPWTIAAGVTNGRITNIAGVEHEFDPTDIEFLNQAQMNPIVFKRNRGFVIETENTALTLYKSALSLIHVREVLVELERELSAMLLDYQWKFNTPDVRAEIKLRADVICETYVNRNGLFNYFNKMDDENNTSDIIDSQIGVLDTYVEPIKGMGIIVNNVTILRTGAIAAGGFQNA